MSLKIKALLGSIIICMAMLLPRLTHADEFLTKSVLLNKAGIKLYVGENQKSAIVFHKRDIGNIKDSDLFVLTSTGARSLKGKLSSINLQNECGDPIPGVGFKNEGYDGFLVVTGKHLDKIIRFYPGQNKPIRSYRSCLSEQPKEQLKVVEYTSMGLEGTIQRIRWKRTLTKDEVKKQCDEFAKWNVKIDRNKRYDDLYDECISGPYFHCPDEERVVINLQDKNGKCLQITNYAIDCDGKAPLGVDLRDFLGVLKVEYKTLKEVWLLWNAPGYEGDGIYSIEINDISKKKRLLEEWLVYNGC